MPFVHISGLVQLTEPSGPVDPGYGGGWGGNYPTTGPIYGGGHPSHGLPIAPVHPGNKPPGRPIVPPHPGNKPPTNPAHPWMPGHWEIIDPGWGKPPLLGFLPVDPGFGISETPPPTVSNELPGGNWVPVDPDYGLPERCPGGRPHPPLWAWIPAPPDLTKPIEPEEPAPKY